ncbi:DUF1579 domain-containing protein [Neorhizobium sp. T786]|uniref:DUF1579 domain-containing protein n=1 Tax=Pseudorhizobium xiangyangii TaxID=2883104 RepID=UPI001CFF5B9A|nr:DUF1579 domain-containing protein [Neorhizobium xiangyangii]MCB5202714.1 DUF1579 domain-containing protein [Neorhizobium xiangyangii]
MEMVKPQAEHGFLQKLVGTWEVTAPEMAGHVPWTENVRSLEGIWFVCESRGEMPGCGEASIMMTLGFDAARRKYVASWVGSMMDHLWVYEGDLSADGTTLSLYTTGPDHQNPGKAGEYREQIVFKNDDHRIFNSSARQPVGSWKQFMEAHYHRKG